MSKSIAIINTPKGCGCCIFNVCVFFQPFWNEKQQGIKCYRCQLDEQGRLLELDLDDNRRAEWCPLKEVDEL